MASLFLVSMRASVRKLPSPPTQSFHRRQWILYVFFGFPVMWSNFGYWSRGMNARTISSSQFPCEWVW
ncbi:hypothetical protein BDM02DRAFT_3107790 [Thelephora ganbajun]|uniref:Uncharacterized protein n=1 Tax=Thelephora ganbajun TaxID=370292 RepID=A0ACB6ZUX1_THEGA|nr:hypothetical protein BDM02DRAFT_3107790 [Thelephora ganbajun]